jgi:hypothetical protein
VTRSTCLSLKFSDFCSNPNKIVSNNSVDADKNGVLLFGDVSTCASFERTELDEKFGEGLPLKSIGSDISDREQTRSD